MFAKKMTSIMQAKVYEANQNFDTYCRQNAFSKEFSKTRDENTIKENILACIIDLELYNSDNATADLKT